MSLVLNAIVFALCMLWFYKENQPAKKLLILPIVLVFLLGTSVAFGLSLFAQNDLFDGLNHLMISAISIWVFWLWTTMIIIRKNCSERKWKNIFTDLMQNIILLVVPVLLWVWIANTSFKIGG